MTSARQLPLVSEPRNAVALVRQRMASSRPPVPRGLHVSSAVTVTALPFVEMPAQRCAPDFREMFNGFMALRVPQVCEDGTAIPHLLTNERLELCAVQPPADNSAAARRVSLTLLYPGPQHKHSSAWAALDAAALLAWKMGRDVRLAVVCGEDASWILSTTREEARRQGLLLQEEDPEEQDADMPKLLLAWSGEKRPEDGEQQQQQQQHHPPARVLVRREFKLPHMGTDVASSARRLQTLVLYEAEREGFPAPASLSSVLSDECSKGMYGRVYKMASSEFAQLAKGPPIVERRCLPEEPMQMLEFSGQCVRLCPRVHRAEAGVDEDGASPDCVVDGADCMHAMLLSAHGQNQAVSAFLAMHRDGLRPAQNDAEERMQMHVLGVTSVRLEMNASVTLYAGTSSAPGKPINSPRSWMTQLRPVLWPLSHELCHRFFVLPCGLESWRPREDALAPYAMQEALLATKLFVEQLASVGHRACDVLDNPMSVPSSSCLRKALERSGAPRRSDELLLAALQMPITSQRATLGEAYSHVARVDPGCALATLMLRCACKLGADATLVDGFEECARSLKREREVDRLVSEGRHAKVRALLAELAEDEPPAPRPEPSGDQTPPGALMPGRYRPPGGATTLAARLIRGMHMKPVMVGDEKLFKLSHKRVDTVDMDDMIVYLLDLLEIESRPRKKALKQLIATVRSNLKIGGFLEALRVLLKSCVETTRVDAFVYFTRQDGTVECARVKGTRLVACPPEALLRRMHPLMIAASEGQKNASTLRLAPWRARVVRGPGGQAQASARAATEAQAVMAHE